MADDIDRGIEVQEDEEVAAKTIVGGRPMKRRKVKMSIPAGIEKTIYKASVDPEFKQRLFEDRFDAIEQGGFKLTDNERNMLAAIPDSQLAHIIGQVRPAKHGKRKFMKAVATAVVTLATSTAVVACDEDTSKGITPEDTDTDTPMDIAEDDIAADLGISPDTFEDTPLDIEDDDAMPVDGIMPDAPPDVPLDIDDDGDAADADEGEIITDVGIESLGITPDE